MAKLDKASDLAAAVRRYLSGGSQTAPALLDDAAEALPVNRMNTLPVEAPPQVIGGAAPTPGQASNIMDADFTEITPTTGSSDLSWMNRMDPRLKRFAQGGALGAGAGYIASELYPYEEENGQTPLNTPPTQAQRPQAKPEPEASTTRAEQVSESRGKATTTEQPKQMAAQEQVDPSTPDYTSALANAQGLQAENNLANAMLRAGIQGGAALAGPGVRADYTTADALSTSASAPVRDTQALQASTAADQRIRKQQDELNDESKLRAKDSDISKTARQLAKTLGINVTDSVSAKQLQDAGLPLGTLLSTKIAADARRDMYNAMREERAAGKETQKNQKVQASVDKQVSQLLKSKDLEAYNAAKDAQFALTGAIDSDDDKIKAGAAFMQYAKIAQGDNSVVRDGDMAQLAGRYNYTSVSDMMDKLVAQARGGKFGERELEAMREVAAKTQQIKAQRVNQQLQPIVRRAGSAGLDLSETLDPTLVEEFSAAGLPSSQAGLTTQSATTQPQMVRVTRISDGATKMMPASSVANMSAEQRKKYTISR